MCSSHFGGAVSVCSVTCPLDSKLFEGRDFIWLILYLLCSAYIVKVLNGCHNALSTEASHFCHTDWALRLRWWRIWLQCRRPGLDSWVETIVWRREWLPTPVFLLGKFQRSLAGSTGSPWGYKELDMTEWLILSLSLYVWCWPSPLPTLSRGFFTTAFWVSN